MFRFILTCVFIASSITLNAQTIDPPQPVPPAVNMFLAIHGNCKPAEYGFNAAKALKQAPLFFGNFLVNMGPDPTQSQPIWTQLWTFVNQDNGQFSMFALMPDGIMCMLGSGSEFTPYSGS